MTPELISIFGVAVMLSVQLWRVQSENRQAQKETTRAIGELRETTGREIGELRETTGREIGELRERMARLEGLFEGYVQQNSSGA